LDVSLPAGYSTIAVVPLSMLGQARALDEHFVLATRDVDWAQWERYAQEHEKLDDARFERLDEVWQDGRQVSVAWVPHPHSHPPHTRWLIVPGPGRTLAGADETGQLRRLTASPIEDVTHDGLHALRDDGEVDADTIERLERDHYSSKIGGAASFVQATIRAVSRTAGSELAFLAQLRPDVAYEPYGYTYYVFGDLTLGQFAVTYQR